MSTIRWAIVATIFGREVKDQLRDRRTLFMIFVLPILLYPILGISVVSLSTAFEQKPRTIVVVGAEGLPTVPPLLNTARDGFDPSNFAAPAEGRLLRVQVEPAGSRWADPKFRREAIRGYLADAVLIVPTEVREQLRRDERPSLAVVANTADEQSRATARAVREVVENWTRAIVAGRLKADHKPAAYAEPVEVVAVDVATVAEAGGTVWARVFPFLLVMMALTGAFYPAVDLCAGEKERGTMETLLLSPASREEIVMGKFLTVMVASMGTALLNLLSMGLTGWQLAGQLASQSALGGGRPVLVAPSMASAGWMVLLLVPLAAFFSAVCLALAVLARSMKEGQYYMTPLYMVALPLIFATLAPGIKLDLFTSLVPITGVSLLLRALMQGDYDSARRFALPVLVPLMVYAAIALRWAVDQFRRESVLFREAERFDLKSWVVHLVRDRRPTPSGGAALACFAFMLTSAWFLSSVFGASVGGLVASQLGFILAPPVLLTLLLTSSPRATLRLRLPGGRYLALAAGLALAMNPLVGELRVVVEALFPAPEGIRSQLEKLLGPLTENLGLGLLVLAVVPAICEEFAFRGFILSGLQGEYRTRTAILLSAFLFGFLHVLLSLFQQLFNATLLGIVLGYLAVQSGSILPGILFHAINNGLALLMSRVIGGGNSGLARALYRDVPRGLYHGHWVVLGAACTASLLYLLARQTPAKPPVHGKALI